nr:histone deacetylase 14 [Tanacetum cinerariifolium]
TFQCSRRHTLHTKTREYEFKPLSWKCFGEYIRELVIYRHEVEFNHASLNLLSNEVMTNVNVLRPGVLDVIATQSNGTAIITIQGNLVEVKAIVSNQFIAKELSTSGCASSYVLTTYMICICIGYKMADVNASSGQTPTMAPPECADDQILPHIRCQLDEQWFVLTKETLREALQITPVNNNQAFAAPPSIDGLINFVNQLGYPKLRRHRFHPRPDSSLHLPNEEPVLRYLKFSAKGTKREVFEMPIPGSLITTEIQEASYYQEYLAKEAQHRRCGPVKQGEKKRKQVIETFDKPPKAKKSKHGWVSKKRSLKNVEASKTKEVPIVEPQVADEDADYQKALEESMKTAYALPRGPLPLVVIREPEPRKYQPVPEVPRKGKAKSDSEEESKKVILGATTGGNDEDQAGPDPGHAGPDPGSAGDEEQSILSHVVHAGSDREHMDLDVADVSPQPSTEQLDEGFIATFKEMKTNTTTTTLPPPQAPKQSTAEAMMVKRIARKKTKESRELPKMPPGSPSHQLPPPPPPAGPSGPSGAPGASRSSQAPPLPPPPPLPSSTSQESPSKGSATPSPSKSAASAVYQAWIMTDIRLRPSISSTPADLEMDEDMGPDEQAQLSDDEDIRKLAWSIPSSDAPVPPNNWASALASSYLPSPEDLLLAQTGDMATFIDWFCKRRGITELKPQDLEGPTFEIIKVFHPDVIHLQYQMEECHKLLTNSVDDPILRNDISKPLPLGGPPGQVTI